MTIGIGVLASEKSTPDTAILVADTKGSFGQEYSMNRLHKIFEFPEVDLYATAADSIDLAAEALPMIASKIAEVPPADRSYGEIKRRITRAILAHKNERFATNILPQVWNHPEDLKTGRLAENVRAIIDKEWKQFPLGFSLVVASFDARGQAFLFMIDDEWPRTFSYPGFAAIGSGAGNAMFWLSYRNHHLGLSVKHAAYHAFEAKVMAESSPFVNEKVNLLIARKGKHVMLSDFKPSPPDAPFSIEDLRKLFGIYGPKDTDELTPLNIPNY